MTDITAKPFDWNDNLSKEALEDFEGIRKDLPYCICQNIGMALAKLELLEKQGCKVIDPSGSSSEKPNKCEDAISRQAVLDILKEKWNMFSDANDAMQESIDTIEAIKPVTPQPKTGHWIYDKNIENWRCSECGETPKTLGYCGTADFMAEHFKYCNHCGIRMVEPQEGGDQE